MLKYRKAWAVEEIHLHGTSLVLQYHRAALNDSRSNMSWGRQGRTAFGSRSGHLPSRGGNRMFSSTLGQLPLFVGCIGVAYLILRGVHEVLCDLEDWLIRTFDPTDSEE